MPLHNKGIYEPLASIVARYSMPIPECGCHVWLGITSGKDEYGRVRFFENGKRITKSSHRAAYEVFKGPIPEGMQIDHICNMPWCVNPDHLRAVKPEDNTRKAIKEFCDKGHRRIEIQNYESRRKRKFDCPVCRAEYLRRYYIENGDRIRERERNWRKAKKLDSK